MNIRSAITINILVITSLAANAESIKTGLIQLDNLNQYYHAHVVRMIDATQTITIQLVRPYYHSEKDKNELDHIKATYKALDFVRGIREVVDPSEIYGDAQIKPWGTILDITLTQQAYEQLEANANSN